MELIRLCRCAGLSVHVLLAYHPKNKEVFSPYGSGGFFRHVMQLVVSCNGHIYITNGHSYIPMDTLICQWTHLNVCFSS